MQARHRLLTTLFLMGAALAAGTTPARASDFMVYSVYQGVDLGMEQQAPQKDYYVNMGANHGLRAGMRLEVYRKSPSYDLANQKLYRDVTLPVGTIKVIHVEGAAAVARLESLLPAEQAPVVLPRAVMVGDIVKIAQHQQN